MQMMTSFIGGITFGSGYWPGIGINFSTNLCLSKMPVNEGISLVAA